ADGTDARTAPPGDAAAVSSARSELLSPQDAATVSFEAVSSFELTGAPSAPIARAMERSAGMQRSSRAGGRPVQRPNGASGRVARPNLSVCLRGRFGCRAVRVPERPSQLELHANTLAVPHHLPSCTLSALPHLSRQLRQPSDERRCPAREHHRPDRLTCAQLLPSHSKALSALHGTVRRTPARRPASARITSPAGLDPRGVLLYASAPALS
ncbi:hypothetical protein PSPO01_12209, partial [Paraphaeosphaeria sporulosa]